MKKKSNLFGCLGCLGFILVFVVLIGSCASLGVENQDVTKEIKEVKKEKVKNKDLVSEYKTGVREKLKQKINLYDNLWEKKAKVTLKDYSDGKVTGQSAATKFKLIRDDLMKLSADFRDIEDPGFFDDKQKKLFVHTKENYSSSINSRVYALNNAISMIENNNNDKMDSMKTHIKTSDEYLYKATEALTTLDEAFKYKIEK
ncbi:hypothetical protein [Macrococcus capreoli]|uniref:hypothetical protein n=1 Tax=Macrococcus capreoli TaxID=2982690 RepID=UPI003F42E308